MIDLHCHLLPGVDDGAADIEEALSLARLAVANGIQAAVLTPHIHPGRYENSRANLSLVFDAFRQRLQQESIPLQIGLAAELRIDADVMPLLQAGQVPLLGRWQGSDIVLLEMPHNQVPHGIAQFLRWLSRLGLRAMIAHPERNKDVMRHFDALAPLLQADCLFQVTADALTGGFGAGAQQVAQRLLSENRVTILASDAHNDRARPPRLEPGRRAAEALIGESLSWELVRQRPQQIAAMHFAAPEAL